MVGYKYQLLYNTVPALLTCFLGPNVESSFNLMGNIMDKRPSRLKVDRLAAIQTVKYALEASWNLVVQSFSRKDKLHTPVSKNLCRLMKLALAKYIE